MEAPIEDALGDDEVAAWLVMFSDPRVMVPLSELADRAGLAPAPFAQAMGNLAAAGLLDPSSWGGLNYATLTPFAAARIGVKPRLARGAGSGVLAMIWVAVETRERAETYKPKVLSEEASLIVGFTAEDREPIQPPEAAEAIEAVEALVEASFAKVRRRTDAQRDPANLPRPTVLLTGCQPWTPRLGWHWWYFLSPVGEWVKVQEKSCPACHGKPLRLSVACLRCDRWGGDFLLRRMGRNVGKVEVRKPIAFKPTGA